MVVSEIPTEDGETSKSARNSDEPRDSVEPRSSVGQRSSVGTRASVGTRGSVGTRALVGTRVSTDTKSSGRARASIGTRVSIGTRASIGTKASKSDETKNSGETRGSGATIVTVGTFKTGDRSEEELVFENLIEDDKEAEAEHLLDQEISRQKDIINMGKSKTMIGTVYAKRSELVLKPKTPWEQDLELQIERILTIITKAIFRLKIVSMLPKFLEFEGELIKKYLNDEDTKTVIKACNKYLYISGAGGVNTQRSRMVRATVINVIS